MLEREVYDIAIASLSTLLLFIFLGISDSGLYGNLLIWSHVIILLSNFIHIIFRQLNRLNDQQSFYFVLVNLTLNLLGFLIFLILDPNTLTGYWDDLPIINNYKLHLSLIYSISLVLSLLSKNADLI